MLFYNEAPVRLKCRRSRLFRYFKKFAHKHDIHFESWEDGTLIYARGQMDAHTFRKAFR